MVNRIAAIVCGLMILIPASAAAHGELEGTDPVDGAVLEKAPARITVTLSEDPGPGSVLTATDGCDRKVGGEMALQGAELVLSVAGGGAGKWKAAYKAISAEDGHVTHGRLAFTVSGPKDCSKNKENKGAGDDQIAGGGDTRVDNPGDEGGGFPIVPFALGTAAVIGLALILRRVAAK